MPARIDDIARHLGVSAASVSRALNDRPGVSEELRRRILAAAHELDFAPNMAARGLATQRTQMMGLVLGKKETPLDADPFYPLITHGAEACLAEQGYHLILTTVDGTQAASDLAFKLVREQRVDGLILAGPDISPAFILAMRQSGVPCVLVDNCLQETRIDCVVSDDQAGAAAAVQHLLQHGHQDVLCLSGPQEWASSRERSQGYHTAMREAGLAERARVMPAAKTTIDTGQDLLQQAFAEGLRPSAVFAINDSMAIGAMRAAQAMGLRLPEDLAVIGFDDISWAELATPPLTTVRIYKEELGALAARRLLDLLAHAESPPVRSVVGTQLVLRRSCGC
ncbi:MAG TPA: LacI family DNA-binding transcriptional regulator [Anaerolineae bacterium]|nr:LacI family DNA-binding transcriptional regulator [Anaerolineae bacterium]HOQ97581.1 LacI family DNA-binding transcriptional regulator [Anaerolineae bacterium]HPL28400.1 LacI family DNA-binding transcriptional regulator [Anaerolineae bacterium]